ncbi:hypothetical protein [Chromatium okenii]|jgi:hypothetical protein|uniref:hypothetical protein n=1 Tax=Chromatium okenii TaxID=61644 RepID=UPI0026EADD17|nr:hypothetical protein [Chromatium okenii]MBV5309257.1 hypothetical protein [Chromatium okenii]
MKKQDSWCTPIRSKNGNRVSGGAARNVRIAALGGLDTIIENVVRNAVEKAFLDANTAVRKNNLKLVS